MWDKNGETFNKRKGEGGGLLHFDDSNSYNNWKAELVRTSYKKWCAWVKKTSILGMIVFHIMCYVMLCYVMLYWACKRVE